jgi:glycosyltransferase involved in cell wall biosynthesis
VSGATREVALVCAGDDADLGARLRAATWRGIVPTVMVGAHDERALRLAVAAGAEVGSVWPDVTRPVVLVERRLSFDEAARLSGRTVVAGESVALSLPPDARLVRLIGRANETGPGSGIALGDWDEAALDGLVARGWRLGPAGDHSPPAPSRLDGLRVLHLTSVHRPDDGRIFHKEVMALRAAGADATVLGLAQRPARSRRLLAGWRLVAEARRRRADIVHIHDPELLPAAWLLRRLTGRPVIYDAHEYLGQTTRTKPWIPGPLRLPTAVAVERLERTLAGRADAVVAVTEDMAIGFAEAGIQSVSVANFASRSRFPEPGAPDGPVVVYVGALDGSRGLNLMLEAFPMVEAPGARLLLAGPGNAPALPASVEHIGPVPYDEVPALLARAAIVWIPLRRTPNNDRGRLTKVMEAMASGRPLVASNLTRTAAIVGQAGCGMIVPHDDPAAHAAALTELLRDPARAARMGAAGRAAFLERMTFEGEAAKLVALYAEIAGRTA